MPVGNVFWSDMTPQEQAEFAKRKARADALGPGTTHKGVTAPGQVPTPVSKPSGKTVNSFAGLKAYTSRTNRSVYSK